MAAWGVGPGELQRMSSEQRARLAERPRGGRIGRFADLIGRFRQVAAGQRARKTEHAPASWSVSPFGDNLGRLIPSERAALGVPVLRAAVAARYAERGLFIYETRGEENTGQGAIIACIDCSGSMGARAYSGSPVTRILSSSPGQHMTFRFPAARAA